MKYYVEEHKFKFQDREKVFYFHKTYFNQNQARKYITTVIKKL